MIRDEYRNHYNDAKRTKLEEIAKDCATAIATITPRIVATENAWSRRDLRVRIQRPRIADAS